MNERQNRRRAKGGVKRVSVTCYLARGRSSLNLHLGFTGDSYLRVVLYPYLPTYLTSLVL